MDFTYYRSFITVVESGSLTAAAHKLNLAQPALSVQMKIIEKDYGIQLLKMGRGVRNIELTSAGELFYEKARYLCAIEESARLELQNHSKNIAGTLKISLSPARAQFMVEKYIKPFSEIYNDVHYQIYEVDVNTQMQHILNGVSEIAIANAPLPEPGKFAVVVAQKENFVVVANKKNPLVNRLKGAFGLKDLENVPLATNFGSYPLLKNAFLESGFKGQFVSVSTTRTTAVQFALQDICVAVIPAEPNEKFSRELYAKPLAGTKLFLTRTVFISKTKSLSAVAQKFLSFYTKAHSENI